MMKRTCLLGAVLTAAVLGGCTTTRTEEKGNLSQGVDPASFYLPGENAARVVTVSTNGTAAAQVLVQTQRVAVKEGGPEETVEKFGEVYAFSTADFRTNCEEPRMVLAA